MARIKPSENGTRQDVITGNAAGLFRLKGFTACSMRELAESIGVEAPSLYNHIGSKSEILQIICFKVASAFNNHLAESESNGGSIVQQLEELIRFHIRMMIDHYDMVYVANHEWKQLEEPFLNDFLQQRKNYENRLINIISKGIKNGELKDIHPYVTVLTILSAVRGLESWHRNKKNVSATILEKNMLQQLLNGIIK